MSHESIHTLGAFVSIGILVFYEFFRYRRMRKLRKSLGFDYVKLAKQSMNGKGDVHISHVKVGHAH